LKHFVPAGCQKPADKVSYFSFVIHNQNAFPAVGHSPAGIRCCRASRPRIESSGQKYLERGASIHLTFHENVAAALFHNTVNSRQSKTTPSLVLRRKERFENVRTNLQWDACTRIAH